MTGRREDREEDLSSYWTTLRQLFRNIFVHETLYNVVNIYRTHVLWFLIY